MSDRKRKPLSMNTLVAGALVFGVVAGVGVVTWQNWGASRPEPLGETENKTAQAWYQSQARPPTLPTGPAPLMFQEGMKADDVSTVRAYEEALPKDVYVPPVKSSLAKPKRDATNVPTWKKFAVAAPLSHGGPMIAVVIDDMGVDLKRSPLIAALPGPLTLSYLTYAQNLEKQTSNARKNGHELMLHVSMEPISKAVDPGPNVLMVDNDADELRRRLEWGFSRFDGYVGINNHMGSKFTADEAGISVVMDEVEKRGLLFLDSRTSPKTVAARVAREKGVPVLERNIFIDNIGKVGEIIKRLAEAEGHATAHGHTIIIGHPRSATIRALKAWLPTLPGRGFELVPVSALLADRAEVASTSPSRP